MSPNRNACRRILCVTVVAILALPQLFNVVELKGLLLDWDWISGQSSSPSSTFDSFINNTGDWVSSLGSSSPTSSAPTLPQITPDATKHRSDLVYLPLLPWEQKSLVERKCNPPTGVPRYCCIGSLSAGGSVDFAESGCDKGIHAYNFSEIAAMEELSMHPVPNDHWIRCDICRIVDIILENNWILAMQGDSISRQIFAGLECELRRRGYVVAAQETFRAVEPKPHWRFGLDVVNELKIRKKTSSGRPDNAFAIIRFYGIYRPSPDMVEILDIANSNDLLIFDHGLHYGPASENEFYEDMTVMLNAITTNATRRLKLLAWRETSAQHFDTPGGHFLPEGPTDRCVPIAPDEVEGGNRLFHMMQQVMNDTGLREGEDLVIFPFRTYTSQFPGLKTSGDCSHFCSSPALWLPLWRMMRIAIDSTHAAQ